MQSIAHTEDFIIFTICVVPLMILDALLARGHGDDPMPFKKALMWSGVWVGVALLFGAWLHFEYGPKPAIEYLTGYIIELSLSVDNLFVFILVFGYFAVPKAAERRALTYGIIGAIVMRAVFIVIGAALLHRFNWLLYLLGGVLILSSIKLLREGVGGDFHPEKNPLYRTFKKLIPSVDEYHDDKFFIRRGGKLLATPLFLVVIVIESTDLVFAVDSIPAIFGITRDPFIVFTSNIFAIIGLRSFYAVVSQALTRLRFLNHGLALVLGFIGFKMLFSWAFHLPVEISLGIVISVLVTTIVLSKLFPGKTTGV